MPDAIQALKTYADSHEPLYQKAYRSRLTRLATPLLYMVAIPERLIRERFDNGPVRSSAARDLYDACTGIMAASSAKDRELFLAKIEAIIVERIQDDGSIPTNEKYLLYGPSKVLLNLALAAYAAVIQHLIALPHTELTGQTKDRMRGWHLCTDIIQVAADESLTLESLALVNKSFLKPNEIVLQPSKNGTTIHVYWASLGDVNKISIDKADFSAPFFQDLAAIPSRQFTRIERWLSIADPERLEPGIIVIRKENHIHDNLYFAKAYWSFDNKIVNAYLNLEAGYLTAIKTPTTDAGELKKISAKVGYNRHVNQHLIDEIMWLRGEYTYSQSSFSIRPFARYQDNAIETATAPVAPMLCVASQNGKAMEREDIELMNVTPSASNTTCPENANRFNNSNR